MDSHIILQAHSGWRFIVIVVGVLALLKFLIGWLRNGNWSRSDQNLGAALPIVMDIQLLLGLVLWIMQQRWSSTEMTPTWEHPVTMLIAIAIAHIGWSRTKKSENDQTKFRTATLWFALALVVVGLGVARITSQP